MIEFKEITSQGAMRPIVLKLDSIQTFHAADGTQCAVVLDSGRTVVAALPYAELRRIVLEARRQFVTVL
jgi:hypothetical protein